MEIPKAGERVTALYLINLAQYHEKDDIWRKLHKELATGVLRSTAAFESDGCSCWPDSWFGTDIYEPCFWHDVRYWLGGSSRERLFADAQLMLDIAEASTIELAMVMFNGVRIGGSDNVELPWSWGYGKDDYFQK